MSDGLWCRCLLVRGVLGVSGCQSGYGVEGDGAIRHVTCSRTSAERGQGELHLHCPARGEPGGAVVVPQPQFLWLWWSTQGGPPIPDPSPKEDSMFWEALTFPRGAAKVSLMCGAVVARGSPRLEPFAPFAGKRPCGGSAIAPQPPVPPTAPARCTGPQQPPQHVWLWDINPGSRSPFQALWSERVLGTSQLSAGWWDGKLVPKGAGPFSSWSWLPLAFDEDLCLCLVVADLDRSRAPLGAFHLQRYPLRRGRLLCQSRCCYKVVKTMLGRRTCQKEEPDEASAEGR